MAAIVAAIFGSLAKFFTDKLTYYLAIKVLIITAIMVLLPFVLREFFLWILTSIMDFVTGSIQGTSIQSAVLTLTGLAGYIGGLLKLPESFAVIISALSIRLILNFIPFIK